MSVASLSDEFELIKGKDGVIRIFAREYVLTDGSVVVVMDDGKRLTDEGETESNLYIRGLGDFKNRMHALNKILEKYGAKYNSGEIYIEYGENCQEKDYVDALKRLCQAILEVERKIPEVIVDDEYIEELTRTVYVYMCKNNHKIKHHTEVEWVICPFCQEKASSVVETEQTSPEPYTYSEVIDLLGNLRDWLLKQLKAGRFHNPDRVMVNIGSISQWRCANIYGDMFEFIKMMAEGRINLPDNYMRLLNNDVGYYFLFGVFIGCKEYYVCRDCGALYPAEYHAESEFEISRFCDICGDNQIAFVVRVEGTEIKEVMRNE